ncbi:hypothetical protein LTR27_006927 [Elasticomyces elasticus]|nr:hypothetical protein LTR27_006927 [Elasticomyces elasticus]
MATRQIEAQKLLVAVDFGTTFSSVAFALSKKSSEQEVLTWYGDGVLSGEDVPTVLSYHEDTDPGKGPYKWGFQVDAEEQHEGLVTRYEWFKLSLNPGLEDSGLARQYPLETRYNNEAHCEALIVDYLKALKSNFDEFIAMRPKVLASIPQEYIITVPAIWSDKAKDITKQCAVRAGMAARKGDIRMIKEPEAAGIYALDSMKDIALRVNDTFVLCDAGGGTVDLISYTVAALLPAPSLTEAAQGTGSCCGGSFLNRMFEQYLDKKFADYPDFDKDLKAGVMKNFETRLKRTFMGDISKSYYIPVRGFRDSRRLGISGGYLNVPGRDLQRMFKEVIDEIIFLVLAQIRATAKRVKSVLLAGGFGQSNYLRVQLAEAVRSVQRDITVETIRHSNTAIVRGALLRSLTRADPRLPYARSEGRIPTKSYGIQKWTDFDSSKHDRSKACKDEYSKRLMIEVMHWFIEQGTMVNESAMQHVRLYSCIPLEDGPFSPMDLTIYSHESGTGATPPLYKPRDLKELIKLKAKLDCIPEEKLTMEEREGELHRVANFELETQLNWAGTLTFRLKHAGKRYEEESVVAEFV